MIAREIVSSPLANRQIYATSLKTLPDQDFLDQSGENYTQRGIYVNISNALNAQKTFIQVFGDVLEYPSSSAVVPLPLTIPTPLVIPSGGYMILYSRVLTAENPVIFDIKSDPEKESALFIYFRESDQPISYVFQGSNPVQLALGSSSSNIGALLLASAGKLTVSYLTSYDDLDSSSPELTKSLRTQLRIASIKFWSDNATARSIASFITGVTSGFASGLELNLQADALSKQLAASAVTGSASFFAPSLSLTTYQSALNGAIDLVGAFEGQYNRMTDSKTTVNDQKRAWQAMLDNTLHGLDLQKQLSATALSRWNVSLQVLTQAKTEFEADQLDLMIKAAAFKLGLENWKRDKIVDAIFNLFFAAMNFAASIGAVALGDGAAAATAFGDVSKAVGVIGTLQSIADTIIKLRSEKNDLGKIVKSLADAVDICNKLVATTTLLITKFSAMMKDPKSTGLPDISNTQEDGNADLWSDTALAAWDAWTVTSDDMMAYAVDQGIKGALEYRGALRIHAINGKLVCHAQAQAAKVGQEYMQLSLSARAAQNDAQRLQELLRTYQGEEDALAEAQSRFYDRMMGVRTWILIQMQNALWAFKYLTLTDSTVSLDPLKDLLGYKNDAQQLVTDLETFQERYSSDYSPFKPSMDTTSFPTNVAKAIVNSIKKTGTATFTLYPKITVQTLSSANGYPSPDASIVINSGPFTSGSHHRIDGMRVYLLGAKAKPATGNIHNAKTPDMVVDLTISTSGIYADIDEYGNLYTFSLLPLTRPFKYSVLPNGSRKNPPIIDSIIPSSNYVSPTPFAQWNIKINNFSELDLTNFTGLSLSWQGFARFL